MTKEQLLDTIAELQQVAEKALGELSVLLGLLEEHGHVIYEDEELITAFEVIEPTLDDLAELVTR